ncbi:patatin-like phospholipase family protein [Mesobacillus subterraneus]|uniref:Patatin family protein n=1 Tax=Mesobacillus subterraneus TaxID=285983 RepID=A0A427TW84_9BACI|nr:patatin family protein [Mesobacillus subterraneus]RSD28709.1 patatin family protein [Mesobacillus subterraneus]
MYESGLILEGGGMRGAYTAGVLDYFLEKELFLPYVIGVSAGACQGSSYVSRQPGRNKQVTVDYVSHPEYISYRNLFLKKELFGMDFIFDKLPNELVPFDFKTFNSATEKFLVGTTDCLTGEPVYFEKNEVPDDFLKIIRASSTLPFMAPAIPFGNRILMDGGIADPIPIRKAQSDMVKKNVIVLTKPKGYRKKKSSFSWLPRYVYKEYTGLNQALATRYKIYNETLDYIEELEAKQEVFVIRPSQDLKVGRVERNPSKLTQLYDLGYEDAKKDFACLADWLSGEISYAAK